MGGSDLPEKTQNGTGKQEMANPEGYYPNSPFVNVVPPASAKEAWSIREDNAQLPDLETIRALATKDRKFKNHLWVCCAIFALSVIIWTVTSFFTRTFPWFTCVFALLAFSLSIHYFFFVQRREFLNFHIALFTIVHSVLFLIWVWFGGPLWWLFSFFGWGMFLSVHFVLVKYREDPARYLYAHLSFIAVLNALVLTTLKTHHANIILIVLCGTAILPTIHWVLHYHPKDGWKMHVALFTVIQSLCFFSWYVFHNTIPWFVFPLTLGSCALFVHYRLRRHKYFEATTLPVTVPNNEVPSGFVNAGYGSYGVQVQLQQPVPYQQPYPYPAAAQVKAPEVQPQMYPAIPPPEYSKSDQL